MTQLKIVLVILFYFIVSACAPRVTITPKELPEAKLEQPYYAKFVIKGGSGPVSAGGLSYSITPINSGIELDVCEPEDKTFFTFNCFIVKGIPKISHDITLKIKGDMMGTMFLGNTDFNKTYVIKVKEAE